MSVTRQKPTLARGEIVRQKPGGPMWMITVTGKDFVHVVDYPLKPDQKAIPIRASKVLEFEVVQSA